MLCSHFGINQFFLDNGLEDAYDTKLYFPADCVSSMNSSMEYADTRYRLKWMRESAFPASPIEGYSLASLHSSRRSH